MFRFSFRGALVISVLALSGLILLLRGTRPTEEPGRPPVESLTVYCAAGLQPPVGEILAGYQAGHDVTFQTNFGGSGALLSEIRVAGGDIFVAADSQYLVTARKMNLIDQSLPIAWQTPVIVVPKGNPHAIRDLNSLLAAKVRLSLADPKIAAIGKVVAGLLEKDGLWNRLWTKAVVHRDTVNQVALDVKLGSADAGIVWDATAMQYPELEMVHAPVLDQSKNEIAVGVIAASQHLEAARAFANYLAAADGGQRVFRKYGYAVVNGKSER